MRTRLGWLLGAGSLASLLVTVFCYWRQPDRVAAFTLMPIWVWGGIGMGAGIVAWYLRPRRMSWVPAALWLVTVLAGADESRMLANLARESPAPGPAATHRGRPVVRVISANCAHFRMGDPTGDIAMWDPDIVIVQEAWPFHMKSLTERLYGDNGEFRFHNALGLGIATRWKIERVTLDARQRSMQATLVAPDGRRVEVVNVHLLSAATDLRLWRRDVWRYHRVNRAHRSHELDLALATLARSTAFPDVPVIFGGDFNAPPGDVIHRRLDGKFKDAHFHAGARWGNTYHRRFPILRIDRIHITPHFTPVRCATHVSAHSDHRFVIADLLFEP